MIVMYYIYGKSGPSLLIESTDYDVIKHGTLHASFMLQLLFFLVPVSCIMVREWNTYCSG